MKRLILLVLLIAVAGAGCSTTRNVSPDPIAVPSRLKLKDVEGAILLALAEKEKHVGVQITDRILGRPYQKWYYEGREESIIYAGYARDRYYMRVKVDYDTERIKLTIIDSKNLDQSKRRIHKAALLWLSSLETRIRMALGQVDQMSLLPAGQEEKAAAKKYEF